MSIYENRPSKMKFFCVKEFFMKFDFRNRCKNEFQNNNEKSRSWSLKRASRKIDFEAVWQGNGHTESVGVKLLYRQLNTFAFNFFLKLNESFVSAFVNETNRQIWKPSGLPNDHFTKQTKMCPPCGINYKHVVRVETLSQVP